MEDALLRCSGVGVAYGGRTVLHDVDLEITPGEVHVLVGPNGAGKTTLANAITGHAPLSAGEILLNGKPLVGPVWRRARQGIGRKFQVPRVFPRLSSRENLAVASRTRSLRDAPNKDIGPHGVTTWGRDLSHGERQHLELEMVHAAHPRLVVLDEPTAGMHVADRGQLAETIRSRVGESTYLIVEHDLAFVRQVADRVSFLHDGVLDLTGSYEEISANPVVIEAYLGRPVGREGVR